MSLDPRITLARADLADRALEGVVRAGRFADPTPMQTVAPSAFVRATPGGAAADEIVFGERFDVLEVVGALAWGQARRDGYVGFVEAAALGRDITTPTHWVSALRTYAFESPTLRSPAFGPLSLNALVAIADEEGAFLRAAGAGWIPTPHLSLIGVALADPAAIAETFLGAPYLWGGRTSVGLDCSGLVQQAFYACGRACPRDSDQQAQLGAPAPPDALQRGDLVFWRGHSGLMADGERLLHANSHHMAVAVEPLALVAARMRAAGWGEPALRRVS